MFKWLKKNKRKEQNEENPFKQHPDSLEASLWEIKEIYDLPTEEVVRIVDSKRKNLRYMHKTIKLSKERKK